MKPGLTKLFFTDRPATVSWSQKTRMLMKVKQQVLDEHADGDVEEDKVIDGERLQFNYFNFEP